MAPRKPAAIVLPEGFVSLDDTVSNGDGRGRPAPLRETYDAFLAASGGKGFAIRKDFVKEYEVGEGEKAVTKTTNPSRSSILTWAEKNGLDVSVSDKGNADANGNAVIKVTVN